MMLDNPVRQLGFSHKSEQELILRVDSKQTELFNVGEKMMLDNLVRQQAPSLKSELGIHILVD